MLTFVSAELVAQRTVIHCGNLIDGKSNEVQTQMTIIVEKNIITKIEKGFTKPGSSDKLIDLSKKTVMPGLIHRKKHGKPFVSATKTEAT